MPSTVDQYLAEGCGRCHLVGTPECKVFTWNKELQVLRQIALSTGMEEHVKWGQPTYTINGKNVAMVTAFKQNAILSFFKGVLLQDSEKLLTAAGENSHVTRLIKFSDVKQVDALADTLRAYLFEAIEIEKAGIKVPESPSKSIDYPEELEAQFQAMPKLKAAFEGLTPGRQRAYLLHFTQAKQSATRTNRIEKYIPKILSGKGMLD
jgi:uncharacterized protein YdeI (YjbR/CyaY-like superfamily)